eukprot:UN07327
MVQRLVIILMLCAFFIAITFTSMDNVAHFSKIHTIAGLLLFILMLFQGMNGTLRPAAPKLKDTKSKRRSIWERVHKTLGYFIWVFGQIELFSGMRYIDDTLSMVHIGWVVLVVLVFTALYFVRYRYKAMKAAVGMKSALMNKK